MRKIIPFTSGAFWTEDLLFSNKVYRFQFSWNARFEYYAMSIMTTKGDIVLAGVKLVLDYDILKGYQHFDIPQGQLIPQRISGLGTGEITRDELENGDVILVFNEVDDA